MDAAGSPRVAVVKTTVDLAELRRRIAAVPDPEIPVVTIADLGILRDVAIDDGQVVVTVTPTYSGCPAMTQIEQDIVTAAAPLAPVEVRTVYSPAWTTDWIGDAAKARLRHFGIAPPHLVDEPVPARCPRCDRDDTRVVSEFGSTACKALMVCSWCGEPFDRFKAL